MLLLLVLHLRPHHHSAAKTLLFYFTELNPTLMQWLQLYMRANPIPRVRCGAVRCGAAVVVRGEGVRGRVWRGRG